MYLTLTFDSSDIGDLKLFAVIYLPQATIVPNIKDERGVRVTSHKTDRSKAVLLLCIFYVFFCLAFAMPLCASVYMCLVVTCWERADLLALVCGV